VEGPWGSGRNRLAEPPDLEKSSVAARTNCGARAGGNLGGRGFALIVLGVIALWVFPAFSGRAG
jgi:hypothetical protein